MNSWSACAIRKTSRVPAGACAAAASSAPAITPSMSTSGVSPTPSAISKSNMANSPMRVAAIGDLHVQENDEAPYRDLFAEIADQADVLLLCGDLTNFGKETEAEILAEDIKSCPIPVLGVLGNHD